MDSIRKRGFWLTLWLVVATIVSILSMYFYSAHGDQVMMKMPLWAFASLKGLSFFHFASVVLIWFWSKSGVIAYAVLSLFGMVISIIAGITVAPATIVGLVVMYFIFKSKWKNMEWGISIAKPRQFT